MADIMSAKKRSQLMARIRGRGTTPERYIFSLLKAGGVRFNAHARELPGCPDLAFTSAKVAVFVDGDYWHGWRFPIWQHRLTPFWQRKIDANRQRDRRNYRRLRHMGWRVIRIWEHQVEQDVIRCLHRIVDAVGIQEVDWAGIETCYANLPKLKRRNRLPKP